MMNCVLLGSEGGILLRLVLPNESRDGEGEDEIVVLMRDRNWMVRQISLSIK